MQKKLLKTLIVKIYLALFNVLSFYMNVLRGFNGTPICFN